MPDYTCDPFAFATQTVSFRGRYRRLYNSGRRFDPVPAPCLFALPVPRLLPPPVSYSRRRWERTDLWRADFLNFKSVFLLAQSKSRTRISNGNGRRYQFPGNLSSCDVQMLPDSCFVDKAIMFAIHLQLLSNSRTISSLCLISSRNF